ncbi:hypothetical protein Nepgr_022518 [Nepenthes gracilis]|uniref:Uncharacterized protein n=1 Tax=Nepenthes gracilis TaxID=150966 RepID=A0AAD3T141_NEPGR|nr:hypothetical protein Nepgr_022518 [Nepenthes gracilis]
MEATKTIAPEIGGIQNNALRFVLQGVKGDTVEFHPLQSAYNSADMFSFNCANDRIYSSRSLVKKMQVEMMKKVLANTYGTALPLKIDLVMKILSSLGGDDEAPQPKESTLAQASLSVISSVLPTLEKSMLDSCGKNPCSCGKNRQRLLYSLRCPAPSPRFIPSWFNCSAGPRSYCSSNRDSFHLQCRALKCWDGQELEVDEESELMPNDRDFQRCWFRGTVLELLWKQMKIQYDEKEDKDGSCRKQTCRSTSAAAFYVVEADVRSSHEACAEY